MTRLLPADCRSMDDIRVQIDDLDRELMSLLAERSRYIDRAAAIKKTTGDPARIGWRVEQVARNARSNADSCGFDADLAETLWRQLIDWSIAREARQLDG